MYYKYHILKSKGSVNVNQHEEKTTNSVQPDRSHAYSTAVILSL